MARLLRYIHPHVSRYAQVDVPCRQTIIRHNRVELFLTVTLRASTPPKFQGLMEPMSVRGLEVLYLIAAGLTNREITEKLFISSNTVKTHTKNINSKLSVNSRTKAVARAKKLGLL